jgi:hypothetical protein
MGSTMCKGVSLQDVLQLNQTKTPKTPQLELLTRIIQVTTMRYTTIYNIHKIFKRYKNYKRKISHPRAKHAPSGFHPTWTAFTGNLITQALKDQISVASPSGILNHLPVHTTTMIIQ